VLAIPWNNCFLKQKGTAGTKQMADPTTGGVAEGLIESKTSPSLLFCTDEHFNTKCASFKM
jgi:hypothetical protein